MTTPSVWSWVLLALTLSAPALARADAVWVIDTLEASAVVRELSLAIDSSDVLHASWCDAAYESLYYGKLESGAWTNELVTGSGGIGSIAVTPEGVPAIGFIALDLLKHARMAGRGWEIEPVDASPTMFGFPAIGLDSEGLAHIGYRRPNLAFHHAAETTEGWVFEPVGGSAVDGQLALDAGNKPRAAYAAECPDYSSVVVFGERGTEGWQMDTLAECPADPTYTGEHDILLATDGAGGVHLTSVTDTLREPDYLVYVLFHRSKQSGASWESEEIQQWTYAPDGQPVNCGLAVDEGGTPHLLFISRKWEFSPTSDTLVHAFRVEDTWTREVVAIGSFRDASLVLESHETPLVFFYGHQAGLFFARRNDATGFADGRPAPAALRLSLAPNPMRGGGTISFALDGRSSSGSGAGGASGGAATISIFDIRGRGMRSFETAAPFGALVWDGADAAGRPLAPGVYFIRLNDGERRATARVTIVR